MNWQFHIILYPLFFCGWSVQGGYENEPTCGRPLGMRLDADGYLIVCDTALGIYKINVATGTWTILAFCTF